MRCMLVLLLAALVASCGNDRAIKSGQYVCDKSTPCDWGWECLPQTADPDLGNQSFCINPAEKAEVAAYVKDCAPANGCLLEYNSALVPAGQECCFPIGGNNTCDTNIKCNALSGDNCCLIYATNATTIGQACCRYADGTDSGSGGGMCGALLAAGSAIGVQPTCSNPAKIAWKTSTVSLEATAVTIVADGQTFLPPASGVEVVSDPGDSQYTTLEVKWTDGVEMRLYIYFRSDGKDYWADEVRSYNGKPTPGADWIIYKGTMFKAPLGQSYTAPIVDLTNADPAGNHAVHLQNLKLRAFL